MVDKPRKTNWSPTVMLLEINRVPGSVIKDPIKKKIYTKHFFQSIYMDIISQVPEIRKHPSFKPLEGESYLVKVY